MGRVRRAAATASAAVFVCIALIAGLAPSALADPPEAPVTEAATSVTGTTATLNGELNPGASSEVGYRFFYGPGESCTQLLTNEAGPVTGQALKVSEPVTELEGNSEYSFCLIATNPEGATIGSQQSFKTSPQAPVVVGSFSSAVTPFAARLEALVNPENEVSTGCVFEYGETTAYGLTAPCNPATLEGPSVEETTADLAGLEPKTTYHFRIVVTNGTGETKGTDGEFTTLTAEAPIVSGETATGISSTAATLEARVNPNYQETTYAFEYATNEALAGATTVAGAAPLPAEFAELPVSTTIGPLQPGTKYFYRVVATNATETTTGPVEQFTTLIVPAVTTGAAQSIAQTSAGLVGTINPGGAQTTYRFAYVDQAGYEAAIAASAPDPYANTTQSLTIGASRETREVGPVVASGLSPGTTYHYALVASNSEGTSTGADATFTTAPPTPPIASTGPASGVTPTGATISASIDTRKLPTTAQFEFGTTPALGTLVPAAAESESESESEGVSVRTLSISSSFGDFLQPGTVYYYRVVATNRDGTSFGAEGSFTTGTVLAFTPGPIFPLLPNPHALEGSHPPPPPGKPLSRQQKLAKALKACARKPKKQRAGCRRRAQRQFGARHKK